MRPCSGSCSTASSSRKKLGAVILAAERTEDANAGSAMDPIVSKMTASPNVLLLGGTVQSVTFHICGDLGPEEKIQSLDEGYGYLLGPEQTEKNQTGRSVR